MNRTNFVITLLAAAAVLGSSIIAFSFGIHSPYRQATLPAAPELPLEPHNPGSISDEQDLEVEVITATENGFDPSIITRPRGPFILALHNMSGEKELVFRIYRAQGEQLQQVRLAPGRRANHQRLDLPPGDYVVAEANHPEWTCALTITR